MLRKILIKKQNEYKYIPLRINVKQPFRDNVERQRLANWETAESSPGAIHNFSPILSKKNSRELNKSLFSHQFNRRFLSIN
jgi:hypothetical protein